MSYFSVDNLTVGYGKQAILKNISFAVESGSLVGILGVNGSGKTTLIKALCGILPHKGVCTLDGKHLGKLSSRQIAVAVGYIPQRSGISIDIPALDVVLMGFNSHLGLLEQPTDAMKKAGLSALSQVGLSGKENTNYQHLSEGQKQLCIFARTLVADRKLLLLDEPESALDFNFRYYMLGLLRDWVNSNNRSAVVSLHDPLLALNFCDRLILLHDGMIVETVEPRIDSLCEMEKKLSTVYGNISLHVIKNRKGVSQIVMLRED